MFILKLKSLGARVYLADFGARLVLQRFGYDGTAEVAAVAQRAVVAEEDPFALKLHH